MESTFPCNQSCNISMQFMNIHRFKRISIHPKRLQDINQKSYIAVKSQKSTNQKSKEDNRRHYIHQKKTKKTIEDKEGFLYIKSQPIKSQKTIEDISQKSLSQRINVQTVAIKLPTISIYVDYNPAAIIQYV